MAENDSMEGKKLELHMFEQKVLEAIEISEIQKSDRAVVGNGRIQFALQFKMLDKKTTDVYAFGEKILTLEEGKKFTYNLEGLKNIQENLNKDPDFDYSDFGLPDIEYLEELQKQREEEQKDEKDLSKDIEEKEEDEEEKPKQEEEKKETKQEEQKKVEEKNKPKNLVKLNDNVIKILVPESRNYGAIYLNSAGEFVGKNKTSGEIETIKGIREIKGSSTNKNIHGTEDKKHKHVNAEKLYQIDNRPNTGFALIRDGSEKGNRDLKFTTRNIDSNNIEDFAYVDMPLLSSQGRIGPERIKEISGVRRGAREQGTIDKALDEVDELHELKVPEDITRVFDSAMKRQSNGINSLKQFKEILCNIVKEKLDEDRPNDYPESHNVHAKTIVDKMVDENKGYEQAKEEIYSTRGNNEKENGEFEEEYLGYGQKRPH